MDKKEPPDCAILRVQKSSQPILIDKPVKFAKFKSFKSNVSTKQFDSNISSEIKKKLILPRLSTNEYIHDATLDISPLTDIIKITPDITLHDELIQKDSLS